MTDDKLALVKGYVQLGIAFVMAVAWLVLLVRSGTGFDIHDLIVLLGLLGFGSTGAATTVQARRAANGRQ